jgi:HEAT repeat protein
MLPGDRPVDAQGPPADAGQAGTTLERLTSVLAHDPVPEVRREAARALGAVAASVPAAVDALLAALDDPRDAVRRTATLALGRTRDPRATEALVDALANRPELWEEAAAALATVGDDALVDRLAPLLVHDSSQVRRGAVRAIAAVGRTRPAGADDEPLFVYTDEEGHRHPLY